MRLDSSKKSFNLLEDEPLFNKDIASALPTDAHNSIVFDPSTMGFSNGSKSDWDIDF